MNFFLFGLSSLYALSGWRVPEGTPLHLRLTAPVGTYASKPGAAVHAVLIAPVIVDGQTVLPAGSALTGKVKSVRRVGFGIVHETAALTLDFTEISLPDGRALPLSAQVAQVDNGRESISKSGGIRGIRSTGSISYRASGYIRTVLLWEVHARVAVWFIRSLVVQVPEPEIFLPAGAELTLKLTGPLLTPADAQAFLNTRTLTCDERAAVDTLVAELPARTYTSNAQPSDVVNMLLIGSREELSTAFEAAGWTEARPISLGSTIKGIQAFAEGGGFRDAPMSALLLNDAQSDMSWQKGLNDSSKRHHVRLWKDSHTWNGKDVWAGAATRDIDFAYLRPRRPLTHRIEENIDNERDKIAHDLAFTSCVNLLDWPARPALKRVSRNASGDLVTTDARLAVLEFTDCSSPFLSPGAPAGAPIRAHGNRWQRFARREILSMRSDLLRANPYWRSYEAANWLVGAIRRRHTVIAGRRQAALASLAAPPLSTPVP